MKRCSTLILSLVTGVLLATSAGAQEVSSLVAYVIPQHEVIRSGIEATVKKVNFADNQTVSKNDKLIEFKCTQQRAHYFEAKEQLADAKSGITSDEDAKNMSEDEKGFAEHRYEAALAEFESAQRILSQCSLSANMKGSFTSEVNAGELVKNGQVVAIVSKRHHNTLFVVLIDNAVSRSIKVGAAFKYIPSNANEGYMAKVTSVTEHQPSYIAITGQFEKPFELTNSRSGSAIFNVN